MEEVDPHVEAAVLWLAQTILEVLFAEKMEDWIRQVGLADDTERLKSEIEGVEAVVAAVKGRAAENRPLARSLGRLKELLYDADDMVDELDYYRLQHQVEGGTVDWANQTQGTDVNGGAQLVDGSRDNSVVLNRNERKKRSKAWEEFSITEEDADGKPLKAECIYCHTVVRCETTKGTSVLHNHLKSDSCKRKRAAIEPNPSSAVDGSAAVAAHCSDSRKRMRIDEESANNTAASTRPWNKAEFCNRIQQTIHQLQKAISEVQKLYGSGSVTSLNLCRNTAADPCRRTSSLVQRKMYGRVAEKNSILQLMTEDTSDGALILPIVGIGGIGKSALAQLVYNDPIVKNQFDLRMWVWVSSNFDEVRLTLDMLHFVSHEKHVGISSLAKLQEILVTHVMLQRTLLILDDVWKDIDDRRWNKLLAPLRSDNVKGNVILVTTRKLSIARRIGTVEPIKLGSLHTDDFWPLFKTCAFGDENYKEHLSLNIIGQEIAEKLQGNPLAAETAGTLLREYLTINHWSNILKSEKWKSLDLDGGIMQALKLSYDELPYYLQLCFLYCSIFPPRHQFVTKELIYIWISQGFVKCDHSTIRLEDTGRNHLTDLVNSGFFEQVETQDTTQGDQTCYVISSLMHEFARQVSRTFCATINGVECIKILPSVRHLSIVTDATYHEDHGRNILPTQIAKLRTLVLIGQQNLQFVRLFEYVFHKARCLRLLQISSRNADYASLSCDSISPTHLRYLKLVDNDGDGALSHSLSKFYHLQVLDVGKLQCPGTHYNMNRLVSLRHLNFPKGVYSSIAGIGKMTSLQELHDFSIDGSSSSKITELQFMNELLQLGVSQLENIGTRDEACGAKLSDKGHLEKLHLSWKDLPQDEYASDMWSQSEDESLPESNGNLISEYFADRARAVLEGLEPQHNLKHIQISGYHGPTSPAWLGTSVTCLQTLHLEDCGEWKILPSLGRLPFLTKLELRNMRSVIEVSLPSLEELVLMKMPKLERCVCNSISELNSRIKVLKIGRCRVLKAFPLFECCEKLKIEHRSWLPRLNKLTMYRCPCLTVSNPLPPSSKVCELDIAGVSTLPTMRSTDGELIIGDFDIPEESDNLTELDSKILSFHNLRAITRMEIARCQNLSYISLKSLVQLKSLNSLLIYSCENLFSSDVLPEHVHEDMAATNSIALPSLKHLNIDECGITGMWLSMILQHAPSLEELDLDSCRQLSVLVIEGKESSLSNHTSTPLASSPGNADDVLTSSTTEGLLRISSNLIPSLKKIITVCCYELTFQGNKEGFSVFTSLEELTIRNCPKLIPSLVVYKYENGDQGNGIWLLPCSLRELTVNGLDDSLETLQPCFPEDRNCLKKLQIGHWPSLKSLDLRSCTALEELMVGSCRSLVALEGNFTCLKELVLDDNSGLESLQLCSCTALEELTIGSCRSLAALEGNFTCLRKLLLWGSPRLRSVRLRFCEALEDLDIQNCQSLDVLEDFRSLRGLRYLTVFDCPALTRFLERLLSQGYEVCAGLERLCTDDYSFLTTSFCECLTSLQRLQLCDHTGEVTRLTVEQERALQLLTSLRELQFVLCDNLADLPVGLHSLPSLEKLVIFDCPRISRLPEKGLPPSLEELDINYLCKDRHEKLIEQCRTLATSKLKVQINGEYVK